MDNYFVVENELLKQRINELEEKLKKYTNGNNHKNYYQKNKLIIKENGSIYLKNLKEDNPDKIKEKILKDRQVIQNILCLGII
jgi:cell division septum initiation protein DivIVA